MRRAGSSVDIKPRQLKRRRLLHTALVTAALVRCAGWRDELHLQNKCFDKDININVWSRSEHGCCYLYFPCRISRHVPYVCWTQHHGDTLVSCHPCQPPRRPRVMQHTAHIRKTTNSMCYLVRGKWVANTQVWAQCTPAP